ncbi:MAG: creatininase family protein [Nitrospira sp.]|nr:creatininase family protein [bacterium]MBL7049284.1 creatininase family protein [Nitrospira sp.]
MILENITMVEFTEHLEQCKTIIFPFGTVEEHGTHLPLNTDTLIAYEILKRVVEKRKVFLAPPVHYGVCTTTSQHPGTLSISPETLRRITYDLVREAYKKGLRNFFLVTGHGGGLHSSALKEAAENLIKELEGAQIAVFCPYDALYKDLEEIAETESDSHAGEIETSLVLVLAPELVKGRSKEEYPNFPRPFIVKDKQQYWPGGVWGNPEKASVEKGEKTRKLIEATIIEVLDRF